jgi:hypothetical protein
MRPEGWLMNSDQERAKVLGLGDGPAQDEKLPYKIELWDSERRHVERLLAQAASATLAQAIFKAAQNEQPERYITLRHGKRLIAETS